MFARSQPQLALLRSPNSYPMGTQLDPENTDNPETWFPEVADTWDLPRLYEDLEDFRRQDLDEREKAYLRGLLHSGSRKQLALDLGADPEILREYLQEHIYPYIAKLTGNPDVASSRIPEWLTAQGYNKMQPPSAAATTTGAVASTVSAVAPAPKKDDPWPMRLLVGGAAIVVTGFVTVLSEEFFKGLISPQESPVASIEPATSTSATPRTFTAVDAPAGVFNYGGSTTWAPIRREVDAAIAAAKPDYRMRYVDPVAGAPGSSRGIAMLLDNQLSFAQSSRPIRDEEYRRAREKGFALQEKQVAIDGIAVVVHPDLDIPGLTITQLQGIYLGRIENWQEVGGPDLAIVPFSREPAAGGTVGFFIKNVLQGQPLGPTVKLVTSTTAGIRAAGSKPGGIYYASAPEAVPQCTVKPLPLGRTADRLVAPYAEPYVPPEACPAQRNRINIEAFARGDYPITRALFVAIKMDGQRDERAGKAYVDLLLTDEGQAAIADAGFVPVR